MQQNKPMTDQDLRVLYDLSTYNCTRFDLYKQVIYEGPQQVREYTNVEIMQESARLAAGLHDLGIEQGDRVLVMMPNSPEVIISYQAISRTGAIIIPVLPLLKATEIRYIAENSGAKAILTSSLLVPLLRKVLPDIPTMRYIIATSFVNEQLDKANAGPSVVAYDQVVALGDPRVSQHLAHPPSIPISSTDIAVILYTSGTTGRPKGVVLTHHNLIANALSGRGASAYNTHETHLAILPLAHAFGIVALNVAYLTGVRIVMHPRFDPAAVLSAIERYRITAFAAVPAMFVALLYAPNAEKYDTSSLQYCVSGSAPLPVTILQDFERKFHCQILEGYGLSEASAALTSHSAGILQKLGSVGKPLENVEIRIVDDHDNLLPTGEVGEVVARGPNIMHSYYNMPDETAAALHNSWLYTGDMGRFDEDGYLYIVERKKDLIIRGGFNIYPRDVEEVLTTHPAVIEAAVIGIPSQRMGEEIKAFVVIRSPVDTEELMAYCREQLANYKIPGQIEFVDTLPRNMIGKIDKKELRKRHTG